MTILGGLLSIKAVTFLSFSVFAIAVLGYLLGRITIKGVNLGTAGVFIVALVYGVFLYNNLSSQLTVNDASFVKDALKIVENLGLILFVTAVGFIAGPTFFKNIKKNFKSYVLLGLVIISTAVLVCVACIFIAANFSELSREEFKSVMVGILSGALTSTPAFSASKEAVGTGELEDFVSLGYGIAYLFGVVGVVLFVQLIPKLTKADMKEELKKIQIKDNTEKTTNVQQKLVQIDDFGIMPFSVAAIIGIFVGSFSVKGFSLTVTGGCILSALVLGHFGKIGKISIMPKLTTLRVFREFGLMLFLIGAGISGGAKFVQYFKGIYFIYGIVITLLPMIIGFLFAKYVLKLPLLNNLGSITGGMTSTPALGTLIHVSGTEDIASAYAATYPIALIAVVVASKLIIMFC